MAGVGLPGVAEDGEAVAGLGLSPQGEFAGWVAVIDGHAACFADGDKNGTLDFFDSLWFQNMFAAGCP